MTYTCFRMFFAPGSKQKLGHEKYKYLLKINTHTHIKNICIVQSMQQIIVLINAALVTGETVKLRSQHMN